MGREAIYRLIVVRPDGTRELIYTGVTEQMAIAMRRILEKRRLAVLLVIEPERKANETSGL